MAQKLILQNVRVHNLKSVSLELEPNQLIVFTGISGSGKTSLAFDTIYVEGQRRYVESLSGHVKKFLVDLPKPDLDHAEGLTPTISIEQKTAGKNPRSTVGTSTEIYDYMRVLWARTATAYCPVSGEVVRPRSKEEIVEAVLQKPPMTRLIIMAPYARNKKGEFKDDLELIAKKGFLRVRIDNTFWQVDDKISIDKTVAHSLDIIVDRIEIAEQNRARITESLLMALELGSASCSIYDPDSHEEEFFSLNAFSPKSGLSYPPLDASDFSFNSPQGSCPECQGLGISHSFALDKIIDPEKSIAQDCCSIASSYKTVRYGNIYDNLARLYHFDVHTPWKELSDEAKKVFLKGTEKKWTRMFFVHPETGASWHDTVWWKGVLQEALGRYQEAKSDQYKRKMERFMHKTTCPECQGERLKPFARHATCGGKRIAEVTHMTVSEALDFFRKLKLDEAHTFAKDIVKEIIERLTFLHKVGLEYLQLDRTSPTLSGGEAQRVRLASQIGSGLVGVTYILDEPSIGLHARDNTRLIESLLHLRDKQNTVIVIEHDEETIRIADTVVDFGPRAGIEGGACVFQGPVSKLLTCKESLTGAYLSKRKTIAIPEKPRKATNTLTLKGAKHNNLKNIDVEIPLGCLVAVTGVSGSGKSSLFLETLFPALSNRLNKTELDEGSFSELVGLEHIDKVIEIDQSPIGKTPRSNPSTYIKLFDAIRQLYSELPMSRAKGFTPGRFSFNVKEGSCATCHGMGQISVDMDFMEDSWIDCPTCHGKRFDAETLDIRYKDKNIQDVLEMDVREAKELFANIPHIQTKLDMLIRVGLDYIKLGQPSTTLSGGEAQRIKLVKELSRPDTGRTLYILDEPTTGLHFHDMSHLLEVIQALVDKKNNVIVIEHNIDLIRACDWIIEMGPESGAAGGKIIATGTPQEIMKSSCPTAKALRCEYEPHKKSKRKASSAPTEIQVYQAEQNNLKKCSTAIPRNQITVCTGPSGSGKSSFAFETIFAEGQRRYVESLSPYVRQFVKQMPKPKVERIEGLCPAVAIEQRLSSTNPRSTVGTMTEIYDFLRLLYARVGIPHCPKTKKPIMAISKEVVADRLLSFETNERVQILAPIPLKRKEPFTEVIARLQKLGFSRIYLNKTHYSLDDDIPFDPKRKNELYLVVDRLSIDPGQKLRILEAISTAAKIGEKKLLVLRENEELFFNLAFAVVETGQSYPEITPQTFAFNTIQGMCPECQGLGKSFGIDFALLAEIRKMTTNALFNLLFDLETIPKAALSLLYGFLQSIQIDPHTPFEQLSIDKQELLLNGDTRAFSFKIDGVTSSFYWQGLNAALSYVLKFSAENSENSHFPEQWRDALKENICASCGGTRLNPLACNVTINDTPITALSDMPISQAKAFIQALTLPIEQDKVLQEVYDELVVRLGFLENIGLNYLTLSRSAETLSGGEAQRVRLARQIGSGLAGVLYVLDEPTIGLHPQDSKRLIGSLEALKALGNTLLIVEHDSAIIERADHIIEFGPASGPSGGQIIATGSLNELHTQAGSLTAKYLNAKTFTEWQKRRKKKSKAASDYISISNANVHNLKNVSVRIPVGQFTCITGVSGSGKSSLVEDVLHKAAYSCLSKRISECKTDLFEVSGMEHVSKLIVLDQRPIGHTLRSDIATFTDVLTPIRHFYALLPEAKMKGLQPKHFSAYHRKGMCSHCWGLGYKRIEMYFLPAAKIACPKCHGLRLNPLSLAISYNGKNVGQLLTLSIQEVRTLFEHHPKICRMLDVLIEVGLGYLCLGQEMHTLSTGETQRMKLARELCKRVSGHGLYLFDEPTTGLHPQEVQKIVEIIDRLVAKGHTVVAIEHNLDFIASSDYVIDLGPGAGSDGGEVVASGSVDSIKKSKKSLTGAFLKMATKSEI